MCSSDHHWSLAQALPKASAFLNERRESKRSVHTQLDLRGTEGSSTSV